MKYWFAGLFLIVNTNVFAEDVIIYRWVDKNNIVHFSQNQPASGNYTEIVMATSGQPKQPTGNLAKSTVPVEQPETTEESANTIDVELDTTNQCKDAKTNLATLTSFERIRFTDKNGETQILNKEQQEEQITINKKLIEQFCK